MSKIAIVTDSNSGVTPEQAEELGAFIVPMPVIINDKTYYEGIDIGRDDFYKMLAKECNVSTAQPLPGDIGKLWGELLNTYEEIVYIPMSSSLSRSYETAVLLSNEFNKRVHVVDNQRISVSQRQSVIDALEMTKASYSGSYIKEVLEEDKYNSSIYITVNTLKYLKKGGRITPAVATIGTLLKIKPILQLQGGLLDSFAKVRTTKAAKKIMIEQIEKDILNRFNGDKDILLQIAHTNEEREAQNLKEELQAVFPSSSIHIGHLPLSIASHIGPGALGVGCIKKLKVESISQEQKNAESL